MKPEVVLKEGEGRRRTKGKRREQPKGREGQKVREWAECGGNSVESRGCGPGRRIGGVGRERGQSRTPNERTGWGKK